MMEYSKPDFVFRVVLVGDVGVGKTAIYNAYRKFYFVDGHHMGYFEVKLRRQNKRVLLKIYDTQGNR